jgi:hypothetical protein
MNDPDDEGTLLDQGGVCLFQPIEKHNDIHSMANIAHTASIHDAVGDLTRQAPGTIISRADA